MTGLGTSRFYGIKANACLVARWYVIEELEKAGDSLVTISVTDLVREVAELETRGLSLGAIESVGDAARKASTTDPDGNSIALV